MCSRNTAKEKSETITKQTVLLGIPPRLQWDNGNGYCGETAVQCIGMSHYISEYFLSIEYSIRGQKMALLTSLFEKIIFFSRQIQCY